MSFVTVAQLAVLAVAPLQQGPPPDTGPGRGDGGGMEEFEEVDPYTKGDKELMSKLGYVTYGPFLWRTGVQTTEIQENLGGLDMIFVETQNFKICSSLNTYKIPNDKEEKKKLKEEFKRLKEKLGRKFKPPKKEIDPWLRVHLYAQRCEDTYQQFMQDFGLEQSEFPATKKHLWQPTKHLVLLAERKSELGRFMRTYMNGDNEYSWRWAYPDGGTFVGVNSEAIVQNWDDPRERPLDAMLHCALVNNLACIFTDCYADNLYGAPRWFSFSMGHYFVRRIDPRWVTGTGRKDSSWREEDYLWEPRVSKLVKNEFFVKSSDMFKWQDYKDLNARDHMVAWSRLQYLMEVAEGDKKGFLHSLCRRIAYNATPEQKSEEQMKRQNEALQKFYGLTPEELDKAWAKWVKKKYKKK